MSNLPNTKPSDYTRCPPFFQVPSWGQYKADESAHGEDYAAFKDARYRAFHDIWDAWAGEAGGPVTPAHLWDAWLVKERRANSGGATSTALYEWWTSTRHKILEELGADLLDLWFAGRLRLVESAPPPATDCQGSPS